VANTLKISKGLGVVLKRSYSPYANNYFSCCYC